MGYFNLQRFRELDAEMTQKARENPFMILPGFGVGGLARPTITKYATRYAPRAVSMSSKVTTRLPFWRGSAHQWLGRRSFLTKGAIAVSEVGTFKAAKKLYAGDLTPSQLPGEAGRQTGNILYNYGAKPAGQFVAGAGGKVFSEVKRDVTETINNYIPVGLPSSPPGSPTDGSNGQGGGNIPWLLLALLAGGVLLLEKEPIKQTAARVVPTRAARATVPTKKSKKRKKKRKAKK
jgi:hypothetical protein